MLLKIYQAGQPMLRQKAKPVSKKALASAETQQLIDYMIETLRDVPGVGLAAPQVGQSLQISIVEDTEKYHKLVPEAVLAEQDRRAVPLRVFVNPQLEILTEQENTYFEGCLSVEGYVGVVRRAAKVRISGLDRTGKPITHIATGWYARMLQHEVGHLNGELYIDRMEPKSFMSIKNFMEFWRASLQLDIRKHFG